MDSFRLLRPNRPTPEQRAIYSASVDALIALARLADEAASNGEREFSKEVREWHRAILDRASKVLGVG